MEPRTTVARDAAGTVREPSGTARLPPPQPAPGDFDRRKLDAGSLKGWILERLASYPHRLICALRWRTPVFKVPFFSWYIVLRYDEVREVLSHDEDFPVDWGERMIEVTKGKNFVLGMPRGDEYRLSYAQLAEAFPRSDVAKHVAGPAAKESEKIIAEVIAGKVPGKQREFDAVKDLITAVPTQLCQSYYGIRLADRDLFANWSLAISSYLFGPSSSASDKALARSAAACLRKAILDSIANPSKDPEQGIVLRHLLRMQERDKNITNEVIHAQLFGMVMGFIPTNVLAGGNILETLLRRPEFMERARAAALADDDGLLWRCLREALRFRHINLGPWRTCPKGYTLGAGGPRPIVIPPKSKVLAIIQSAMFDPLRIERPHVFDPERRDEDYMVFGVGQHWCLGAYIAMAQITQTFKPLLKLKGLRAVRNPAVRTQRFEGLFPLRLIVGFDLDRDP
ncbi:MAG: cytochrome P450 [Burkholderiales bacterium]